MPAKVHLIPGSDIKIQALFTALWLFKGMMYSSHSEGLSYAPVLYNLSPICIGWQLANEAFLHRLFNLISVKTVSGRLGKCYCSIVPKRKLRLPRLSKKLTVVGTDNLWEKGRRIIIFTLYSFMPFEYYTYALINYSNNPIKWLLQMRSSNFMKVPELVSDGTLGFQF